MDVDERLRHAVAHRLDAVMSGLGARPRKFSESLNAVPGIVGRARAVHGAVEAQERFIARAGLAAHLEAIAHRRGAAMWGVEVSRDDVSSFVVLYRRALLYRGRAARDDCA